MTPGAAAARDEGHVALAVLVLAGAAWLLLWSWSLGGHAHHGEGGVPGTGALALGVGWLVMVVAMMLPLAAGLLTSVRRLVRRRRHPGAYVAAAAAGFLAPWLLTGQAAQAAGVAGRELAARAGLGATALGVTAGCAVALVGAFQLSPVKRRSLAACRSPIGFAARRWGGDRPALDAARIGAAYGGSCVACCWAPMCAMLAASAAGVLVMAPLAAVMTIERMTPWGPAFARGTGWFLIALGTLWALGAGLA